MYAIKVLDGGRLAYATYPVYACNIPASELQEGHEFTQQEMMEGYILVDELPGENLSDYRYDDGEFILDPLPNEESEATQLDVIEAQVTYTAMMTDTLLEV